MKRNDEVHGVLHANNLNNYVYYRIDGGSMSGNTALIIYTNITGSTIGTTHIVSYPSGTTSVATIVNSSDVITVTTNTYILLKLIPGQSATINGLQAQNVNGNLFFDGVEYSVGDSISIPGFTLLFVGFGSFLLEAESTVSFIRVYSTAGTLTNQHRTITFDDDYSSTLSGRSFVMAEPYGEVGRTDSINYWTNNYYYTWTSGLTTNNEGNSVLDIYSTDTYNTRFSGETTKIGVLQDYSSLNIYGQPYFLQSDEIDRLYTKLRSSQMEDLTSNFPAGTIIKIAQQQENLFDTVVSCIFDGSYTWIILEIGTSELSRFTVYKVTDTFNGHESGSIVVSAITNASSTLYSASSRLMVIEGDYENDFNSNTSIIFEELDGAYRTDATILNTEYHDPYVYIYIDGDYSDYSSAGSIGTYTGYTVTVDSDSASFSSNETIKQLQSDSISNISKGNAVKITNTETDAYYYDIIVSNNETVPYILTLSLGLESDGDFNLSKISVPTTHDIIFSSDIDDGYVVQLNGVYNLTATTSSVTFSDYVNTTYSYSASKFDYTTLTGTATVLNADTNVSLIFLEQFDVYFTIEDQSGGTISGATVTFNNIQQTSDTTGGTVFTNVDQGSKEYTVALTNYTNTGGIINVTEEMIVNVVLVESGGGGADFIATVLNEGDEPVSEAQVHVHDFGEPPYDVTTATNESGVAEFSELVEGTNYTAQVTEPEGYDLFEFEYGGETIEYTFIPSG